MGKLVYRRNAKRKKTRRNPTLLTLVNPGKKAKGGKVAGKKKAKPKKKASSAAAKKVVAAKKSAKKVTATAKKRVVAAQKAAKKKVVAAQKKAKKSTATAKRIEKANAKLKRQLKTAKKFVGVKGKQPKKTRRWTTKKGTKVKAKVPKRGFHRISSHDRGESSVDPYWRFQPNAGGSMRPRRRKAAKRRPAKRRRTRSMKTNPRKRPARRRPARKPARRKAMRRNPAKKRPARRKAKRNAPKRKARRKAAPKRRKARRNPSRKRRAAPKRRRKYKRNPKPAALAKQAVAGFAGFLLGRVVNNVMARHVAPMLPVSVQPMAALIGTGAGVLAAYYIPKKVKKIGPVSLVKYQSALLVGASVAFLDVLFATIAPSLPASVTGYLAPPALSGMGSIWPQSFSHEASGFASTPMLPGRPYGVQMGEYIQSPMGEYIQSPMGEYVQDDLDAGVVSDGLYGDPGDDDIDIEVLD